MWVARSRYSKRVRDGLQRAWMDIERGGLGPFCIFLPFLLFGVESLFAGIPFLDIKMKLDSDS